MQLQLANTPDRSQRANGYLFVLSNRHSGSIKPDDDYMIVGRLGKHPKGFLVQPVPENAILVSHSGFACAGPMCRTDAVVREVHGKHRDTDAGRRLVDKIITPGLVQHVVKTTNNVTANWSFPVFDQAELDRIKANPEFKPDNLKEGNDRILAYYKWGYLALKPGRCYVLEGETRACGLPDLTDVQ